MESEGAQFFAEMLKVNQTLTSVEYAHPFLMTDLINVNSL